MQRISRAWTAIAAAISDSGREAYVQFIVDLAARVQGVAERLSRLEAQMA